MKTFKSKSAQEQGIDTSREFIVVKGNDFFSKGEIITIRNDEDAPYKNVPVFWTQDKSDYWACNWNRLAYAPRIGDRVKVDMSGGAMVGNIINIENNHYRIQFDDENSFTAVFRLDEIEYVEEEKFKVGDRVKIVNCKDSNYTGLIKSGDIDWRIPYTKNGLVGYITTKKNTGFRVDRNEDITGNDNDFFGIYQEDELELVENQSQEKSQPKVQVGDLIRILRQYMKDDGSIIEGRKGEEGKVKEISEGKILIENYVLYPEDGDEWELVEENDASNITSGTIDASTIPPSNINFDMKKEKSQPEVEEGDKIEVFKKYDSNGVKDKEVEGQIGIVTDIKGYFNKPTEETGMKIKIKLEDEPNNEIYFRDLWNGKGDEWEIVQKAGEDTCCNSSNTLTGEDLNYAIELIREAQEPYFGFDFKEAQKSFILGRKLGSTSMYTELIKYKYNPSTRQSAGGNKIMSNIKQHFKDLNVSADDKALRQAELKDSELNWTEEALDIVSDLEAKERGYKSIEKMTTKFGINTADLFRLDDLITKHYNKLLENAKKFNKANKEK